MSLLDAFQLVATRRRIWPNDGFCRHLFELEKKRTTKRDDPQSPELQAIENELQRCAVNNENTGVDILPTKP